MTITKKELDQLGISRNLYTCWKETMQALLAMCRQKFNAVDVTVEEKTEIVFGRWRVSANIINNEYIEVCATKDDVQMITVRWSHNLPVLVHSVYLVIKFDYAINM